MRIKKRNLGIAAALVSSLTLSALPAGAEQWGDWSQIRGILVHDDSLEVTLTGGSSDCDRVYRLATTEPNYDVKASATLAAYYAGHGVSLYWSGDSESCFTRFHRLKVRP